MAASWYDHLTCDHTVCRFCFAEGQGATLASEYPEIITPTLSRNRTRDRRPYTLALKRAFRLHLAKAHPAVSSPRWSK